MFKVSVGSSILALLCVALSAVNARSVNARAAWSSYPVEKFTVVKRDVVSPPITYPTTGTVWVVGEQHNVTWDTSGIPPGFQSNGMIVLGFLDPADGENEHLDLAHPLATGFPITSGRAQITVPSVQTRATYILVLFGDSGDASGKFTIKNISIGTPPASSTASAPGAASSLAASGASPTAGSDSGGGATPASADGSSPSVTGALAGPVPSATAPALQSAATQSIASGTPTSQISGVAESAGVATSTPTGATSHSAAFGRPQASDWMFVPCVVAVLLGLLL